MKRFVSLLLCVCLLLSSGMSAVALEDDNSIDGLTDEYFDEMFDDNYEPEPLADSEAVWLLGDSIASEGTFEEMWNMAVTTGNGIVQLRNNIVADSVNGFGSGDGFFVGGLLVPENVHVGLDLNGYTLNRNLSNGGSNKRIITLLKETCQLDIYDSVGGGILTGLETDGSAVFCNGVINMYGGSIRENTVGQSTIWVGETGQFNLLGSDVESEVVINTAKAGAKTAGIYVQGVLGVGGSSRVQNNKGSFDSANNVLIACDSDNNFGKIVMLNALDAGNLIYAGSECGSSAMVYSSDSYTIQDSDVASFLSDDTERAFSVAGDCIIWHRKNAVPQAQLTVDGWSITGSFAGMWNVASSLGKGEIKLLTDVVAGFERDTDLCSTFGSGVGFDGNGRLVVEHGSNITIDLNSYDINKNMSNKSYGDVSGELFMIMDTGTLTVKDSTNSGMLTGSYGRDSGAVHVCVGGIFNFEGGVISGNQSMNRAGGIVNHGTVSLSGGRIVSNNVGMYLYPDSKTYLSGQARVYDNTHDSKKSNMVIGSGANVYVRPTLSSISRIYFTLEDAAETVVAQRDPSSGVAFGPSDANAFVMDSGAKVVRADGNNLVLGDPPESAQVSFTDKNNNLVDSGSFESMWDLAVASGGGTLRLLEDVDVTPTKVYDVNNIDMALALNGHTININKTSDTAFNISNGGSFLVRGKNDPTDSREVVETVSKDATNLRATFLEWNKRTSSQPFGTMKYIHYMIEESAGQYELVKYTHDFTDVGKLVFSDGVQGFLVSGNSEMTISGGLLLGSSQLITVDNNSKLSMTGGFIYGHKNTPVIVQNNSSIDMRDGEFIANSSTTNGGAIWIKSGCSGNFTGGTIAGNMTTGSGGGIAGGGTVTIGSNLKMSMNQASAGGAIAMTNNGVLNVRNRTFIGSQAVNGGGSIWANSDVVLDEVHFVGVGLTGAGTDGGGALRVTGSGNSLTLTRSTFNQCEGSDGGSIAVVNDADAAISDTSIKNSKATGDGGAVYAGSGRVLMENVSIENCTAKNGGGVSFLNGYGQFAGTIDGCTASANGGGIYVDSTAIAATVSNSEITNNKAVTGAGIYIANNMASSMITDVTFESNTATGNGGGMYIGGTDNLKVLNTKILSNKVSEWSGYGSAVELKTGVLTMQGCEIAQNAGYAGTVNVDSGTNAVIAESDIHENTVKLSGGGVRIVKANIDILNTNIRANVVRAESTSGGTTLGGGGVLVRDNSTLNLTGSNVTNNTTHGDGGGICQISSVVRVTNSSVIRNTARNGGGIYCSDPNKEVLSVVDSRVSNNEASDRAGGINTRAGMTFTIGGTFRCIDNTSNYGEDNVYLRSGIIMQIIKALTNTSDAGVTTVSAPTAFAPIPFIKGIDAENAIKYFDHDNIEWEKRYDVDTEYGNFVNDSAVGELTQDDNTEFDGVLVQYYAVQNMPRRYESGQSITLLDTSGKVLPTNEQGNNGATMGIFINETTGEIDMQEQIRRVFKARVFDYDPYLQAEVLNRFMKEDGWMWTANEIWVLKDGKAQTSLNRADWDIVTWEPGKTLRELGIEDGDCIRILSTSVETDVNIDTTFYDYDITNGYWYATESDAKNDRNRKNLSEWNGTQQTFHRTAAEGINSLENYTIGSGSAYFTYGNNNTGVTHANDAVGIYFPNKGNSAALLGSNATHQGSFFGLVTGVDENGHLVYNDGVRAPAMFNDGDAIGKTKINDMSLQFKRVGDTYTLTKVRQGDSDVLTELNLFKHPQYVKNDGTVVQTHTKIWTNSFWPMDEVGVAGTDGHDMLTGNYDDTRWNTGVHRYVGSGNVTSFPCSDDSKNHNSYFGMHFTLKFSTEEDYVAPLGYYFFGDDDMWVFLDGELVCDIGGVHSSAGSYTNLRDYIPEGDAGEHELTFFYTERGASGSTCWMQFNLPHDVRAAVDDQFMFLKTNENGKPLGNAVFGVYRDQACTDLLQTVVSDEEGSVNVTDLDTTKVYYLKEMSAPEDYIIDEGIYVVTFGEGHWSMYEINDGDKEHLDSLVNEYDPKALPEMPETGGTGTTLIYIVGGGMLLTGVACVFVHKKRREYKSVVRL